MMCLPHLSRIFTVFSTRFFVGPGIVGPDAKAIGPRPARHLSGPRGAQHNGQRLNPEYRQSSNGSVVVTATLCHDATVSKHSKKLKRKNRKGWLRFVNAFAVSVTLVCFGEGSGGSAGRGECEHWCELCLWVLAFCSCCD